VPQGLGGLGKNTLAQQVLPWLTEDPDKDVCTLRCREVEGEVNRAAALLHQAKAIGERIRDPRIVSVTTAALERLET